MAFGESKPKLGLIGPVLPYRSGIAQHTTMLHRALRQRAELTTLSFKRQYPAWLFPGETDRDPFRAGYSEPGVEYVIDSMDPRTWRRAAAQLVSAEVQALILPWWTIFFAPLFAYLKRACARRSIPVVFMCHNVVEHEAALHKVALSRIVLRGAQGYCLQSQSEEDKLKSLVPNAHTVVHPHPLYDQFPQAERQLIRRAPLELLFFGIVRPYKGLDVLLEAMALLKRRDVHLSVVGEFWHDKETLLTRIEVLGLTERIEVVPRYVSDQEAADYFARADVVVLPYRSASGTGIIPMAYHYGKPVIATRIGGLEHVVLEGKTGLFVAPESPKALADAIERVNHADLLTMRPHIESFKATMTWDSLASSLMALARRP
jgi:glycosyltransferase involved in cell wall biosynthesis